VSPVATPDPWAPRRFWTDVAVAEGEGGWEVRLDGSPVRTPARAPLRLPTRAFAEAVAAEWAAVEGQVDPRAMPATRLANAALDKVAAAEAEVAAHVASFGASDLLCYRAEGPPALVARQDAAWDPVLAWAADALGARLVVARGVMPVAQDRAVLAALRACLDVGPFRLAALYDLVALSGSLVLGLAVAQGWLGPEEAWSLSRLDEDFQAEEWGADEEAEAAAAGRRAAFLEAARLWRLLAT
jgi:chaperone required for assembly of F1-ATPase